MEKRERKTDHRSRYTQSLIKHSLLTLLNEKPLNKISVSELCAAAGINRGTFYNHFDDVHDVSYGIEQDFYKKLQEKLAAQKTYKFDKDFFYEVILLIGENMELVKVLLADKSNSGFLNHIIRHIHNRFSGHYAVSHPHIGAKTINDVLNYSISGSIGIITEWVNDNSRYTAGELAALIERFNDIIVAEFIKNPV